MKEIIKTFKLEEIYDYVFSLIWDLKEKWYYYHNLEHTIDVTKRSLYLAEKEWLNFEEKEILVISALFHDTWFTKQYSANEPFWAKIAKNFLEKKWFKNEKIEIIENTILATSVAYTEPKNIFEKIIKDADVDNLWREDENILSENLKKELETIQWICITNEWWLKNSINFLENYEYFTKTQKKERDKQKSINLENYKMKLKKLENDFF